MPYEIVQFQDTPNPNALKCVLDGRIAPAPRSFFNAEQAKGDALATALFAIPGVTNVLIHDGWITLSKAPDTDWKPVKAAARKVLRAEP